MASVEGNGFKLEDDIGAKISGFRKEYDNDRDSRDDYGRLKNICLYIIKNKPISGSLCCNPQTTMLRSFPTFC